MYSRTFVSKAPRWSDTLCSEITVRVHIVTSITLIQFATALQSIGTKPPITVAEERDDVRAASHGGVAGAGAGRGNTNMAERLEP